MSLDDSARISPGVGHNNDTRAACAIGVIRTKHSASIQRIDRLGVQIVAEADVQSQTAGYLPVVLNKGPEIEITLPGPIDRTRIDDSGWRAEQIVGIRETATLRKLGLDV